ncbi:hypothetical protein G5B00_00855 [Parapedobacter sp. SGR-10]|uniref:hypothetical protein n=1 Tax=Parapedobacter sp. SGR-10 TaxID=2710879 RepID=UPI0013D01DBA|nr:hypothetical protein [Parapedobacter sp. SGR-10]NGF55045.1 hypothetical protein [Parapedobacter sp. SGR-10]
MKKFFILILSLCYTMVSIGATFQIHRCAGHILWSVSSEKLTHDACPLCGHSEKDITSKSKDCHSGDCADMEFKFDQLTDKLFSFSKDNGLSLSPAVVVIPWIQEIFSFAVSSQDSTLETVVLAYADSSPPVYLTNCIFRI